MPSERTPPRFTTRRRTTNLLGWPTDVVSVDPNPASASASASASVHTLLVWVPGNPGQHDWYHPDFIDVLNGLGPGYAVRSLSHAGHGLVRKSHRGEDVANSGTRTIDVEEHRRRGPLVPWTVEGQVLHKIAFVDGLLSSSTAGGNRGSENGHGRPSPSVGPFAPNPRLVFLGHSFGCHVVQRMCVLRPDILERTAGILFLMPYVRSNPSLAVDRAKLNAGGSHPDRLVSIGTGLSRLLAFVPEPTVRGWIRKGLPRGDDDADGSDNDNGERVASVAARLLRDPLYPRTFFELGTEEIRDIPNEIDATALRLLSSRAPPLFRGSTSTSTSSSTSTSGATWRGVGAPAPLDETQARHRPVCILYARDNDVWCPSFHGEEIGALQSVHALPESIERTAIPCLRHDYVCQAQSVRSRVNDWCISRILRIRRIDGVRGTHAKKPSGVAEPLLSSKL